MMCKNVPVSCSQITPLLHTILILHECLGCDIASIGCEYTASGTEFAYVFCAGIGPLQLGVVRFPLVNACSPFFRVRCRLYYV